MTHGELISIIHRRLASITKYPFSKEDIYSAIIDVEMEIATKHHCMQASGTLTLTEGVSDYTISTAIGTNVGEIYSIIVSDGELQNVSTIDIERDRIDDVVLDDTETTSGTPNKFRVWNGILKVYPTPQKTEIATVYYLPKVAHSYFKTIDGDNSETVVPFADPLITPIVYKVIGILFEMIGEEKRGLHYLQRGDILEQEIIEGLPANDRCGEIKYHEI